MLRWNPTSPQWTFCILPTPVWILIGRSSFVNMSDRGLLIYRKLKPSYPVQKGGRLGRMPSMPGAPQLIFSFWSLPLSQSDLFFIQLLSIYRVINPDYPPVSSNNPPLLPLLLISSPSFPCIYLKMNPLGPFRVSFFLFPFERFVTSHCSYVYSQFICYLRNYSQRPMTIPLTTIYGVINLCCCGLSEVCLLA